MAHIGSLSFGVIAVNGSRYRMRDVVIYPDGSVRRRPFSRWMFNHHTIQKAELDDLIAAGAEAVVVGIGTSSAAKLSEEATAFTTSASVEITALSSQDAVEKFNQLAESGRRVGALIHITC